MSEHAAHDVVFLPEISVAMVSATAFQVIAGNRQTFEAYVIDIEPDDRKYATTSSALRTIAQTNPVWDETFFTWGLQAVGAAASGLSGFGVRIAVLDTGVDLAHPDLMRRIHRHHTKSFIPDDPSIADKVRHGTHCVGIVGGPRHPVRGPRYGVACDCEVWVGKVLGDDGEGQDSWILAGLRWAVRNKCRVVSLSLGSPVLPSQPYSKVYETAAARALQRGTLVIAAAGNDSSRYLNKIMPVSSPANCPSVLAVGALSSLSEGSYEIADFSNGGINPDGGAVDVSGPGVFVYSSFPLPIEYYRDSGTSMATPHVAGIAGLLTEANPCGCPRDIWAQICSRAKQLPISASDAGAGLVSI